MSSPRVTLLESHDRALRAHLERHGARHEGAAIVLLRRISVVVAELEPSDRFISVEVHPFDDDWITSSSISHVAFETRPLREFFRRCKEEGLVFGFVHNHPSGLPKFSKIDDDNERTLLQALTNRNGTSASFMALLLVNGTWMARVRYGIKPEIPHPARHVLVPARPVQIHVQDGHDGEMDGYLMRQVAAFGKQFVRMLQSLRVGVVGAGGTGSPTATLLARSGIGELVLIDPDRLEESNLNRVRGARAVDVDQNKAFVLDQYIRSIGLDTKSTWLGGFIDSDPDAVDALASCDIVFGCTDDQIGREVVNTAAYVYAFPYIDVGLGGQIVERQDGQPVLRYHHGRVSTILPERGECLFCQGVVTDAWIRRQYALRDHPEMSETEARERYLEGGGEEAPGVGPFTSAIADYGLATLYDLVSPFRHFPPELRWDAFSIDFVRMRFRSTEEKRDSECPYCGTREFLLLREELRLGRPLLGSRDVSY